MCGASRRSSRAHRAWNVEIHIARQSVPSSASTLDRISCAALFVNVTASTPPGSVNPELTMWAIRWAMTRVLPDPAPARMRTGPEVWRTASRCSGFRLETRSTASYSTVTLLARFLG